MVDSKDDDSYIFPFLGPARKQNVAIDHLNTVLICSRVDQRVKKIRAVIGVGWPAPQYFQCSASEGILKREGVNCGGHSQVKIEASKGFSSFLGSSEVCRELNITPEVTEIDSEVGDFEIHVINYSFHKSRRVGVIFDFKIRAQLGGSNKSKDLQ